MPRVSEDAFTKTQRNALMVLVAGPREREANNTTNLLLERKGYLRRVGEPKLGRYMAHSVIVWEITEAGLARLAEG